MLGGAVSAPLILGWINVGEVGHLPIGDAAHQGQGGGGLRGGSGRSFSRDGRGLGCGASRCGGEGEDEGGAEADHVGGSCWLGLKASRRAPC